MSAENIWASTQEIFLGILSPRGPDGSYTLADLSIHFFLQLGLIILTCRTVGWLGQRFLRQPQVVGEMVAGVLLGPSLLGLMWPEGQAMLFPPETRGVLYVGAQLGVGLYMFMVGTTFRSDHFAKKGRSAFAVSLSGIAAPFLFAVFLTPWLLTIPGLFAEGISRFNATLFLGACIALTAFPMLARIINEQGLAHTSLGTLTLAAGAFDDAVSWCVLALVLAAFGGGAGLAVLAVGGGLVWTLLVVFVGKRLLAPLGQAVERSGEMSHTVLALTLIAFCVSAFVMDAVGIHAIFGGFILGTAMPRGKFTEALRAKIEPLAVIMLLPLFFTYSGLNTRLDMVNSLSLLLMALAVLAVAVAAKFGACYVAARLSGEDNRTSLGIGALMNARGLMELIIINIGLQKGIIGPTLFSVMVLMAIITTVMASPLFEAVYGRKATGPTEAG